MQNQFRLPPNLISFFFTVLAPILTSPAFGAPFTSHDLYPLAKPGGGITQVFPTGFHPAADGVVGGQGAHGDNFSHAFLWTSSANPIDLNPAGFTNSYIWAANGTHQVGYAANNRTGLGHGYLWSGTAASGIDLTPAGYSLAAVYESSDSRQVGSVAGTPNNFVDHAATWSGSAASFVDINPANFTTSKALNLDATHEIGSGSGPLTGNAEHALFWTDGGAAVDLHPAGFASSEGQAVRDGREVGLGYFGVGGEPQALLWVGASPVATNLTPIGFGGSIATDVSANGVVGYTSTTGSAPHAAYWSDSAASFVDLHALLGPSFVNSQAFSIGEDGTIYGTALDSANVYHAVSWTATPALAGDYNGNGVVDAADYVVWRATLGSTIDLRANGDNTGASAGKIDEADYNVWRLAFGNSAAVGAARLDVAVVPEPAINLLVVLLAAFAWIRRGP